MLKLSFFNGDGEDVSAAFHGGGEGVSAEGFNGGGEVVSAEGCIDGGEVVSAEGCMPLMCWHAHHVIVHHASRSDRPRGAAATRRPAHGWPKTAAHARPVLVDGGVA
jgi:hypothetical protein